MARSGCLFGPTGTFKTTQVKRFAHYIARLTGKATLLLCTDSGGWAPCEPEIRVGMIRPFRLDTSLMPMSQLRAISRGNWPMNPDEPDPRQVNFMPINYDEVGGLAFEGWTSTSELYMGYLPDKGIDVGGEIRSKLGGFQQPVLIGGELKDQFFRSNTRGDYREVQKTVHGIVTQLNSLPFSYVLHTALDARGKDEDGKTVYGPAIAGQKATGQCGPWIGDLIHAQEFQVVREVDAPDPQNPKGTIKMQVVEPIVRYYFERHLDQETNIPYPAKPRVPPEKMRELKKRFPGGYFEPKLDGADSLDAYLEEVDRLSNDAAQSDALNDWRAKMDQKLGRGKVAGAK